MNNWQRQRIFLWSTILWKTYKKSINCMLCGFIKRVRRGYMFFTYPLEILHKWYSSIYHNFYVWIRFMLFCEGFFFWGEKRSRNNIYTFDEIFYLNLEQKRNSDVMNVNFCHWMLNGKGENWTNCFLNVPTNYCQMPYDKMPKVTTIRSLCCFIESHILDPCDKIC